MTREPSTGKEPPNDTFLSHIRRIHTQPIERNQLPETSNQEIGWFNKVMKTIWNLGKRFFDSEKVIDTLQNSKHLLCGRCQNGRIILGLEASNQGVMTS